MTVLAPPGGEHADDDGRKAEQEWREVFGDGQVDELFLALSGASAAHDSSVEAPLPLPQPSRVFRIPGELFLGPLPGGGGRSQPNLN